MNDRDEERALEDWLIGNQWGGVGSYDLAAAIVASEWLADRDTALLERVALAIEAETTLRALETELAVWAKYNGTAAVAAQNVAADIARAALTEGIEHE